jgi:hypothetical protein
VDQQDGRNVRLIGTNHSDGDVQRTGEAIGRDADLSDLEVRAAGATSGTDPVIRQVLSELMHLVRESRNSAAGCQVLLEHRERRLRELEQAVVIRGQREQWRAQDRGARMRRVLGGTCAVLALTCAVLVAQSSGAFAAGTGIGVVKTFATRLTSYVTAIAASVAVLFMAVNGVRWTMSSGHPGKQAEARQGLVAAAAGLAIALSAGLIVSLVVGALQ